MQTTAAACADCLCKTNNEEPGGPGQGCKQFAASVFLPECPPRIKVTANVTFEYWSAGGFNRGCKGMLYADPIWARLRRGTINVSSRLYRVQCNGTTPYSIQYKRQNTCPAGQPPEFQGNATCGVNDTLICPDRCQVPTGCRGYFGRDSDSPCVGATTDFMGTEITKAMLTGLPLVETRETECNQHFYSCTHLLGANCSGCSVDPDIPFGLFGNPDPHPCSGYYTCASTGYSCPPCTFDVLEDPVVPHIRCAFEKTFCYTIKDFYTNCVDTFIHIPKPILFVSKWRVGDPWIGPVNGGYPTQPAATGFFYPWVNNLYRTTDGNPINSYTTIYPFTWGKRITNAPMCVPEGQYNMYGNMGSGLTPTPLNRCSGVCVGTNSLNQTLNFVFDDQNFTSTFTACNDYWVKNCGSNFCAGYVRGPLYAEEPSGVNGLYQCTGLQTPQCCCRPYQYQIWDLTPIGDQWYCADNSIEYGGPADPPVCWMQESLFGIHPCTRSGPEKVLEYTGHDSPLNQCRQGDVISWSQEEYDYTTEDCDYWQCCSSSEYCFDEGLGCGTKSYNGCDGIVNCPPNTCDVSASPFGFQTESSVAITRPFDSQITVEWEFGQG